MDITLALGGGGSKGNAHIGVLRSLEQEGFDIKVMAGTSFGGLVAVFYALRYSPDEIEEMFAAIRPQVTSINTLDRVDVHEVVNKREEAVNEVLPELKKLFTWRKCLGRRFRVKR